MKEGSPEPFSLHCPKLTFVTTFLGIACNPAPKMPAGAIVLVCALKFKIKQTLYCINAFTKTHSTFEGMV